MHPAQLGVLFLLLRNPQSVGAREKSCGVWSIDKQAGLTHYVGTYVAAVDRRRRRPPARPRERPRKPSRGDDCLFDTAKRRPRPTDRPTGGCLTRCPRVPTLSLGTSKLQLLGFKLYILFTLYVCSRSYVILTFQIQSNDLVRYGPHRLSQLYSTSLRGRPIRGRHAETLSFRFPLNHKLLLLGRLEDMQAT